MKKRKKKNYKERLIELQNKINLYGHTLHDTNNVIFTDVNTSSWFDIKISNSQNLFGINMNIINDDIEHDGYYTRKIKVYPTDNQKQVLFKWMEAYIMMYNVVTKYFKQCMFQKIKANRNVTKLKKKFYDDKNIIIEKTKIIQNNKEIHINSHILDYAINDSIKRYESCISNKMNGNIRNFRLRYLKQNKSNKLIKLEKSNIQAKSICVKSLGDKLKCDNDNFNYLQNYHTLMTLHYSSKTDEFNLLVKYKVSDETEKEKYQEKNKIVSIDPGIRAVLTGYSNDHIIKIGTNVQKSVRNRLRTIDKIRNRKKYELVKKKNIVQIEEKHISKNKKDKIIKKKYAKMRNRIMDMQWKIAKYMTDIYKTIIIGNFSTKDMGENKKIRKMLKRIGNAYNMYKLKEKLKYKSKYTNTKYKEIDESYTSKCCSNCGNYKRELKGEKIYECKKCRTIIDRDINGSKNILMLAIN